MISRWRHDVFAWCRVHAPLFAPIGIALAFATVLVTPAQAIWFQVLSADVSVTTGVRPTEVGGTSTVPSTTPEPSQTPEACDPASIANLHFTASVILAGEGPFEAVIEITNDGDETAHNVMLGFAPTDGWEFLLRVDFGNSQYWLIDGLPDGTLYTVGDLASGESAQIELSIQMTDPWLEAPNDALAIIRATVVDLACDETGDETTIELHRTDSEEETPSPEPSITVTETVEPSTTPTVIDETQTPDPETETPTGTETPETITPTESPEGWERTPSPEVTPTEDASPTAEPSDTNTAEPEPSETIEPVTVTKTAVLTRTATRTITPESEETPESETHTPDPEETLDPETTTPEPEETEDPATSTPRSTATPEITPSRTSTTRTHTPTAVPTATTEPTETTPQPTVTVAAFVATPPPLNQVLSDAARPRSGEVLPGTGSGLSRPHGSKAIAGLVLIAVAAGFLGIAVGAGRRLT